MGGPPRSTRPEYFSDYEVGLRTLRGTSEILIPRKVLRKVWSMEWGIATAEPRGRETR